MVYIVYGVSGAGKTTIGELLAKKLNLNFYDADDYHPQENIQKMKEGIPLNDDDRREWLKILSEQIINWNKTGAVLACSALKEKYREVLQSIPSEEICWIFLWAEYEVIYKRLVSRSNHYFKPDLLKSQFVAMEEPQYGMKIKVSDSVDKTMSRIFSNLDE